MKVIRAYLLRVSIGFDTFVHSLLHLGVLGVTLSSRVGTGVAHKHKWAIYANWVLEHIPCFGPGHCKQAIRHDRLRAHAVLKELSDPVVIAWLKRKA